LGGSGGLYACVVQEEQKEPRITDARQKNSELKGRSSVKGPPPQTVWTLKNEDTHRNGRSPRDSTKRDPEKETDRSTKKNNRPQRINNQNGRGAIRELEKTRKGKTRGGTWGPTHLMRKKERKISLSACSQRRRAKRKCLKGPIVPGSILKRKERQKKKRSIKREE